MKYFLIIAALLLMSSCGAPSLPVPTNTPLPTSDTLSTITISEPVMPQDSLVLVLYPNRIRVISSELTSDYSSEPSSVFIQMNDQWGIERLTVNGTTLMGKKMSNHTYLYGEDPNTLIVQKDNTINSIVDDHRRMGYEISTKSLKKCNPYLSRRGLQVGDVLHITCN